MDNQLLSTLDTLEFREWTELTSDPKKCIDFGQRPLENLIRSINAKYPV